MRRRRRLTRRQIDLLMLVVTAVLLGLILWTNPRIVMGLTT